MPEYKITVKLEVRADQPASCELITDCPDMAAACDRVDLSFLAEALTATLTKVMLKYDSEYIPPRIEIPSGAPANPGQN